MRGPPPERPRPALLPGGERGERPRPDMGFISAADPQTAAPRRWCRACALALLAGLSAGGWSLILWIFVTLRGAS